MSVRAATILFDGITAFVLAVIPLYFIELRRRFKTFKILNRGPYFFLACILGLGWLTIFYGSLIEPRLLTVKEYPVALGSSSDRLRIAVITDPHLGIFKGREWLDKVVDRVNALDPDLVIVGGDIAANAAGLEELEPLKRMKSRLGNYAVLGNYDYQTGAVEVRKRIESYGVEVLTNESVPIDIGGKKVSLIGLDDFWYGRPDWDRALAGIPDDAVRILVSHNPDVAPQAEADGIELTIAGHTHGGQIRLPFIGPLTRLPVLIGQRFDKGLFNFGPMRLFISPGVGESGARARLFCPPEISLLSVTF
jgi:uncharacterized protein